MTQAEYLEAIKKDTTPIPEKDQFSKIISAKDFFGTSAKNDLTEYEEQEYDE
jgi:hypothetical protein